MLQRPQNKDILDGLGSKKTKVLMQRPTPGQLAKLV